MATQFDIFAGSYVSVFMTEDITNKLPAFASYKFIPETGAFPESGSERQVIDVPNYSDQYNRKLVGRGSVPSIDLTVNYKAGSIHDELSKLCDDGKRFQIKIVYWMDGTYTDGIAIIYNGFLSSDRTTGSDSSAVQKVFTFEVDGGPVARAIVTGSGEKPTEEPAA